MTRGRHDLDATLPWLRTGTDRLMTLVATLDDDALRAPSRLPGWTRAHVVGHLARNAEALARLATWARTGVETPMYASPEQRAAEIEESAHRPGQVLRADAAGTAAALDAVLAGLDATAWQATVRSALGRAIPAAEIPWMRIREVWLHAVDLDAGVTVEDLPAGVVDLLLDDVTTALAGRAGCPAATLAPTDRARTWQLGMAEAGTRGAPAIAAPAARLAGWLTGRIPAAAVPGAPAVPAWL